MAPDLAEGATIMSKNKSRVSYGRAPIALALLLFATTGQAADPASAFSDAMNQAMARMMSDMHGGSAEEVDRRFVDMMIPHHQGAIDMAIAELCYGTNPHLKRIAQEIIIEQQQEIAAMKVAVGDPVPKSRSAPTTCNEPAMEH